MPALEILSYAFALWLGLYLVARDATNPKLRFTALGLVVYALGLALDVLSGYAATPAQVLRLMRLGRPLLPLSALFWSGATIYLVPEETALYRRLARVWSYGLLAVAAGLYLLGVSTDLIFDATTGTLLAGPAYPVFATIVLLPLVLALGLVGCAFRVARPKVPFGVLLTATLFLTLGVGMLIFPLVLASTRGSASRGWL